MGRRALLVFGLVGLVGLAALVPRSARANCARPVGYEGEVTDAGVLVTPVNFAQRGCGKTEPLVRQNVATGDVVRIDTCADIADGGEPERPYLDTCVPPGKYRYGFSRPYVCFPSACSTDYFVELTVNDPPPAGCVAPVREKLPAAPWGADPEICTYGSRFARIGFGLLAVVIVLLGALVFAVMRMVRKKRRRGASP